jgi:hypothetical protein
MYKFILHIYEGKRALVDVHKHSGHSIWEVKIFNYFFFYSEMANVSDNQKSQKSRKLGKLGLMDISEVG